MAKVLVALRTPDDVETIRLGAREAFERDATMAVCHVRANGDDALTDLILQRRITSVLRATLGVVAEDVAVFIVGEKSHDDLATVAKTWDADVIVSDGNIEPIT